jgi:hypothetical protein
LAFGQRGKGCQFKLSDQNVLLDDWHKYEVLRNKSPHTSGDMNVIGIACGDHQRPSLDRGLPDDPLSQSKLEGFTWIRERKTTHTDQASASFVREIKSTVEERNGFRNA